MGNKWQRYIFEDCMEAIIDYRGKTPKKTNAGIPLITAKIIKNGAIQPVNEYIAEENYVSWMRRGIPEPGDVVLTTEAPLGEVAQLDNRKVALAQRVITLRGKKDFLDNTFLKYLLLSNDVQHQLDGRGTGTTVKGIKQSELRKLELPIPDYKTQKSIAHIIGTLDNKIQLNQQINQTLEAMAQALFKSWFVDFDPVIDNALAAGNSIPAPFQKRAEQRAQQRAAAKPSAATLPDNIRQSFPCEFEHTEELGWVPLGWEVKNMTQLVDSVSTTYPLKSVDKVIFLNTGDIESGKFLHAEFSDSSILPGQAKKAIEEGDILYSEIRPKNKRYAYVNFNGSNHVVSTKLMVLRANGIISGHLAYFILTRDHHIKELQHIAELRSGTFPQITFNELANIRTPIPDNKAVLSKFSELMLSEFISKKFELQRNNQCLEKLRDTLLPKLISGELRLPPEAQGYLHKHCLG